jgi:hypothetical protein
LPAEAFGGCAPTLFAAALFVAIRLSFQEEFDRLETPLKTYASGTA